MIKLRFGNCTSVMKFMSDNSIDMTITSPPYGKIRSYNNQAEFTFDVFKNCADQLYRITKKGGVIVWIVADQVINKSESGVSFKQALYFKEIGFNLHDTMIWHKSSTPFPDKTRYANTFEYMFVFSKGKIKTVNLLKDKPNKWANTKLHGTKRSCRKTDIPIKSGEIHNRCNGNVKEFGTRHNVWDINEEKNSKAYGHPAMFPEKLIQDHIITWSNEGDTILDPFMGSGTSGSAAINLNRDFIGIELDKEYFEIAQKRINSTQSKIQS